MSYPRQLARFERVLILPPGVARKPRPRRPQPAFAALGRSCQVQAGTPHFASFGCRPHCGQVAPAVIVHEYYLHVKQAD